MKWTSQLTCLAVLVLIAAPLAAQNTGTISGVVTGSSLGAPLAIPVIFDTDMGNDIDDALALAMLHALADRGEARLIAVTLTKDNPHAAPFVDLVNTFYGRPDLPVGVPNSGVTPQDRPMIQAPVERRIGGRYLYPRDLTHERAPAAVEVLRRALAGAADSSVVIVQVGFSTNLARLLDSPPDRISPLPGRELAARKVRLLSVMAGDFGHRRTGAEYNIARDVASARKVFAEWPTPLVASGWEVGDAIHYPGSSIERDFGYVEHHPIADAYRSYARMPYDRPTWDLTSVLYGVRPDGGYFELLGPGTVVVQEDGITTFRREQAGRHRYLRVTSEAQRQRALEAMIHLASQPPAGRAPR